MPDLQPVPGLLPMRGAGVGGAVSDQRIEQRVERVIWLRRIHSFYKNRDGELRQIDTDEFICQVFCRVGDRTQRSVMFREEISTTDDALFYRANSKMTHPLLVDGL